MANVGFGHIINRKYNDEVFFKSCMMNIRLNKMLGIVLMKNGTLMITRSPYNFLECIIPRQSEQKPVFH